MTILDKLVKLLELHGVNATGVDRIDIALEMLYQTEMKEKAPKAKEERKPERKPKAEEV